MKKDTKLCRDYMPLVHFVENSLVELDFESQYFVAYQLAFDLNLD